MKNKTENQQWLRASLVQKRMFVLHTLQPESTNYNVTTVFSIQGKYDEERILEALRSCIKCNKMFQAKFRVVQGELEYSIQEEDVIVEIIRKSKVQSLEEFRKETEKGFIKPFQMIGGVLYRIRTAFYDDEHVLIYLDCHHSIFDGNCVSIFAKDFQSAYETGQISVKIDYSHFSEWQRDNQKSASYEEKKGYWKEVFAEPSELCDFLEDHKTEQVKIINSVTKQKEISPFEKKQIYEFCNENKISSYSFFVAAMNLVLAQMTFQKDITIGTVASGRIDENLKETIGMFVNTFPIRNCLNEENTILEYVQDVHQSTRKALKNSDVQYDEICEIAGCSNDRPLFQMLLRYQKTYKDMLKIEGLTCLTEEILPEESTFDFELLVDEGEKQFDVKVLYASSVYKDETVAVFLNQLNLVIREILGDGKRKIVDVSFIQEEEERRILEEFNDTKRDYPRDASVSEVMLEIFSKYKERKAVVFGDSFLTYEELERKSNVLARKLRNAGVKPNDYVGILAQKSMEMLIGVCAIVKAGGAYMPINPDYPKERIDFLIKDSVCKAVLTYEVDYEVDAVTFSMEDDKIWEGNESPLENVNRPMDSIYLMYTSGTTGNPKGVMVCHRNVMRLVKNTNFMKFSHESRILQTGSLSFDASTLEIWGALLNGGTLYLADKELIVSPTDIKALIDQYEINAMFMTTSLFNQMVNYDSGMFCKLEYILFGGEKASRECVRKLNRDPRNKHLKIINGYGPTEATTFSATYQCDDITGFARVPIGKVLANSTAYVMKNGKLCGVGIPGELMLGGDGIAKGYFNRDDLNEEKFVENPFGEGMLYRSGDLAKWLPDGNLDYLGRLDEQVKIRGFRIELGEIESRLNELDEIKDAAAIVREKTDGEKVLCAYVTSDDVLDITALKDKLRGMMPEFMVPAYMMQLETIPVTKNGKLDRRALPVIQLAHTSKYVAPRNEAEEHVCFVMKEILSVDKVGVLDGFFELGGDSIKAIRIVSKMRDYGYDISVRDIMRNPRIEDIAETASKNESKQYNQDMVVGKIKETPIVRLFEDWKLAKPHHFNQALLIQTEVEEDVLVKAFEEIAKHHDMLRAVYKNGSLNIRDIQDGKLVDVMIEDISQCQDSMKEVERLSDKIQSEIDLENGPLVRLGILKEKDRKVVLICIHHLIIDGVSWRILVDDLETAIHCMLQGKEIILPNKTVSFKEWAECLENYKKSETLKSEIPYWEQVLTQMPEGKLNLSVQNQEMNFDTLHVTLSKEETDKLLYRTSKAYQTEINDLLLSALGLAVYKLTGQKKVSVVLEGHGREEIGHDMAIDRTIGWFTSMYPVVLSVSEQVSEMIIETKEYLRKMPNRGIGFGLLHELSSMDADIYFNYLGKMDGNQKKEGFELISSFLYGNCVAKENGQPGDIDLNGMIEDDRLDFAITFYTGKYSREDMNTFAQYLKESFIAVIQHCVEQKTTVKTASDYNAVDLTTEELNEIQAKYPDMEDIYSLTGMQEGLLFHYQLDRESTSYVIQTIYDVKGQIEEDAVKKALAYTALRHEVLRTAFITSKSDKPWQIILENREIEYGIADFMDLSWEDATKEFENLSKKDILRGFDLEKDSLIRMLQVKLPDDKVKFILSFHHIIMDGWCLSLVVGDFLKYYKRILLGEKEEFILETISKENNLTQSYGNYVKISSNKSKQEKYGYWEKLLNDYEETVSVKPMKDAIPSEEEVRVTGIHIHNELSTAIKELAARNHATVNTVLETAWGIVLQKYNHTKDAVFGKIISGRNAKVKGIEQIVGLFINAIPVRVQSEGKTVNEIIQSVQEQGNQSDRYGDCSLADVQNLSIPGKELIQTLFVFENYYVDEERLKANEDGLTMTMDSLREQTNYDITVSLSPVEDSMQCNILYNPSKFHEDDIKLILEKMECVLNEMVRKPEQTVEQLVVLTEQEKERILGEFNQTETDYPKDKTIADLFEEQVLLYPDKTAVVYEGVERECVSYKELNNMANQVAQALHKKGVGNEDTVAVFAEKGTALIAGILGILKAGGAYVPVDPSYPQERKDYMLSDLKPKAVLAYKTEEVKLDGAIDLSKVTSEKSADTKNPTRMITSDSLAYIIYTSGTTGKPKGSMIEQKSVIRLVRDTNYMNFTSGLTILQTGSMSFDASTFEVWGALLNGGKLVLVESETITDAKKLSECMVKNQVNTMWLTSTLFNQMLMTDQTMFDGLSHLLIGGEKLSEEHVRLFKNRKNGVRLINGYGPTEGTTFTTTYEIPESFTMIPIGKAISNTKIYILDGMSLCGIGVPGELCIAGDGVSRGYLNQAELNQEKFVKNPFGEGLLYRSGDLARWLEDGNIDYLGRMDEQVKIRGFRIEPAEIETVLRKMEGITDAAVIVKENKAGEKAVYAYLTAETKISIGAFRKELRTILPDYMLPSYMMQIEKIPVTTNGKLDRRALPDIQEDCDREIIEPRNEMEKLLTDIFSEILGIQHISVTDNFFDLGGHSLRAARMSNKIVQVTGKKVALREILANATVEQLAEWITGKKAEEYVAIPKASKQEYYDMSSAQKRTFLRTQMEEDSIVYNMPYAFEMDETVEVERLKSAFETILARHEILRTSFFMQDGEMVQRIEEKIVPDFEVIDGTRTKISYTSLIQPFDLANGNTVRVKVIKEDKRTVLFVDIHHIVGDGMSFVTFLRELGQAYGNESLAEVKTQYRDYSEWMKTRDLSAQESFWLECYKELPETVNMPLDFARPNQESYEGAMIYERFEQELCEKVKQFAKEQDVTEYMVFLSALMVLISKYARQDDIVVGSPVSARTHKDTESMLGMFVNTLAMRGHTDGRKTYIEFLQEIKEHSLKAFEYQEYPFEELLEHLEVERDTSRNPLFDIMLVFQNNETMEVELNGKKLKEVKIDYITSKFDLTFAVTQKEGIYEVAVEYATKLYKESSVRRMAAHLRQILNEIIKEPETMIQDISMITDSEQKLILGEFNATEKTCASNKLLMELFEESVEKYPERTAVIYQEEKVTYQKLNEMANALAHQLMALGIGANDRVAVMTDRSIEMIAGIFGILKASAAYVPIDKTYPRERISYILEDSDAKAIIEYNAYDEAMKANRFGVPVIRLNENAWVGNVENTEKFNVTSDLAYIIYTSGTTGQPKGVMVENHGVVNLLEWMQDKYPMGQDDVIMQKTTYSFDVSVSEIFWWYLFGGSLVMLEQGAEKEPEEITRVIEKNRVSMIDFVPTMLSAYLSDFKEKEERIQSLKYVIAAGEALNIELVKTFYEKCCEGTKLLNLYGPTEDTVYASWYDCEKDDERVPIGRPVGNGKLYVVNDGQLCGIGVPGELWIGGEQVARGYLNKAELTKEKFIKNPFGTGRVYRSGDLVRWLEDGNIEYYGRIDEQVKVRGFRIELGEVEKCLRTVNEVTDTAVIVKEDSNGVKSIYAYFTAQGELDISEIKKEMAKKIPDYMVPAYMMQIAEIPITGNGKLDRRALPEIQMKDREETYVAPKTEIQKQLCDIFAEILGVKRVGMTDGFFELGGDSIKAIRCVSKARAAGIPMTAKDILQGQNVETISGFVQDVEQISYCQDVITGTIKETPILQTFKNWNLCKPNHFNQSMLVRVEESVKTIEEAVKAIVLHHDMLRAVYRNDELTVLDESVLERVKVKEERLTGLSFQDAKKALYMRCEEMQAGFDLEHGPLVQCAYFHTDYGKQVFLCIHHLVVDGISWRIILEDFETARKQLAENKAVKLPDKTASFMEYSAVLEEYKHTDILKKEKAYWETVTKEAKAIKLDISEPKEGLEDRVLYHSVRKSIPEAETTILMQKAVKIYRMKIEELLLMGVQRTVKTVTGQDKAAIVLEGHGREEIHKKLDIDRTVGWFTSMYPVVLDCIADLEEGIIATKETLKKVPNNGFGYGLLQEKELNDEISFNYLGEMEDMPEEHETAWDTGRNISEENRLPGDININCWITNGKLIYDFAYDKRKYDKDAMNTFVTAFESSLMELAVFLKTKEKPVMTASDYDAKDLTTQELVEIREKHRDIEKISSLTGLQEGMAFHSAMDNNKTGYVIQSVYELKEKPDTKVLKMAIELLAVKHDVLRTAIVNTSVMPRQVVLSNRTVEFVKEEYSIETTIEELAKKDVERGFDLEKDSLFRMKEICIGDKEYLILTFHHIIMDGWCMSLVYADLLANYEKLKNGAAYEALYVELKESQKKSLTYKDYIKWLDGREKEGSIDYFAQLLEGYEESAQIRPMEIPEPVENTMERIKVTNSKEVSEALEKIARDNQVTMNTIMEAAWGILLQRYNRTNDVVFGKVVSGRNADLDGIENVVGLFVNTIPVRVTTEENQTVQEFIHALQKQAVDGNAHDYVGLSDIQEKTVLGSELIKTIFAFENFYTDNQLEESTGDGLKTKLIAVREETDYAITISSHMAEGCLVNEILFNPNTFTRVEIILILERLQKILEEMAFGFEQKVSDIKALTEKEANMILGAFNETTKEYPRESTIAEIFEQQADIYSDKVAIEAVGMEHSLQSITYRELDQFANGIAWKLREYGIGRDMPVAIIADASIEMIAGILGIIKAGGAYVPIDMSYPTERIEFMLEDCQPKAIIVRNMDADMEALVRKHSIQVMDLEDEEWRQGSTERPEIVGDAESMAYIIYTSGTTGKPKGTVIETRGVIRLVKNTNYYPYSDKLIMMQTGSLAFDASTFQIWGPLLNGGKLILAAKEQYISPVGLKKILVDKEVNMMFMTTALFNQMVSFDSAIFAPLEYLAFGGEKASRECIEKVYSDPSNKNMTLCNVYGPTEATSLSTYYDLKDYKKYVTIPIGKSLSNSTTYVMNKGQLCGIGIPGELCLGGDGVAREYLNRPDLTEEKFIPNPYGEGRIYRSGDLVRWMPDGNIEFLGRTDDQVKIRGFRIELAEIESVIRKIDGITDTAVIVRNDASGEKAIYAYYTANVSISPKELKEILTKEMPSYMMPSYMMQIEAIPVNTNGKLDKKALPEIEGVAKDNYQAPENEIEQALCDIFQEILNLELVGRNDNFFEIGGHSLRAARLSNRIAAEFQYAIKLKEIFENSTVWQLAELLQNSKASSENKFDQNAIEGIAYAEEKECYEMSSSQKRIFMLLKIDGENTAYNMPHYMKLVGTVDYDKLRNCFVQMLERHEILRTAFTMKEDLPVQVIQKQVEPDFKVLDIDSTDETALEGLVEQFDVRNAKSVRMRVIPTEEGCILFFDMHHIVGDGMSVYTYLKEFFALYNQKEALQKPARQFKDYSEWMNVRNLETQKEYWLQQFVEEPLQLEMPVDFKRTGQQYFDGDVFYGGIDQETAVKVKSFIQKYNITDYMFFLSAVMILLGKYSRQEDIVVGTPVSARTHRDTEEMLGMFVNTLAMRAYPKQDKTILAFIEEMKESSLRAFENQEYPFEDLVKEVVTNRDVSRNPLFDVMFAMQNNEAMDFEVDGAEFELLETKLKTSKFELTFNVFEKQDGYGVALEYCTKLYTRESAARFIRHLGIIAAQMVENEDRLIRELELIAEEEKQLILGEFNRSERAYSNEKTLMQLFEENVAQYKERVAVRFEEDYVTYEQLNQMSNALAHKLRAMGIGANDCVGLITERSIEMIAGIFAILKAGGAYVPVDKNYPKDRIQYMLQDCSAKVVLVYRADNTLDILEEMDIEVIQLKEEVFTGDTDNLPQISRANDLAYLIYTSGTTGQPKGVMIEHRGAVNLIEWMQEKYPLNEEDVILQKTTYSFDVSITEIFWWYLSGASLVMLKQGAEKEPAEIAQAIDKYQVTMVDFVPTMLAAYLTELNLEDQRGQSLRYVIAAGEALNQELVREFYKKAAKQTLLANIYGPTEITVYASWYNCRPDDDRVPIGKPVGNTKLYVVKDGTLCGIGVPGELWIAGDGVARGYLNREDLTKEKFIKNPFGEGKVYRSGDLVRWLPDGNIEYFGRMDEQVKVRGFRIELGEIETALRQIDVVDDGAVIVREDSNGMKAIYGYFTSKETLEIHEVKAYMAGKLPEYMVPAYMMQIDEIPITGNGKLDRRKLPDISMQSEKEYIAPETKIQKDLCKVFEEILGIKQIGIRDGFFELGGDSIKAIRSISKLRELGYDLTVRDIMKNQTAEAIAYEMDDSEAMIYEQGEVSGVCKNIPVIQIFKNWNMKHPEHFNQSFVKKVDEYNTPCITIALEEIAKHHDVLRGVFRNGVIDILPIAESKLVELKEFVIYTSSEMEEKCNKVQKSMDLENGPLFKAALFNVKEERYLLLCLHHLIVDGVSWRILLEDIETALEQVKQNQEIVLPNKTASYLDWCEALNAYKESKALKEELSYWEEIVEEAKDAPYEADKMENEEEICYETINITLEEEETEGLLYDTQAAFHTEITEVLLTALGMAVNELTGQDKLAVGLEGHGREELPEKIAIDRTVGWFTSMYPVVIHCDSDMKNGLINNKEMMRNIPNHGIGYGLATKGALVPAEIFFNYLGEMDSESEDSFSVTGENSAKDNVLPGVINMNCVVSNGRLMVSNIYDSSKYEEEQMEDFIFAFEDALKNLIEFCQSTGEGVRTKSDLEAKDLSTEDLDLINSLFQD